MRLFQDECDSQVYDTGFKTNVTLRFIIRLDTHSLVATYDKEKVERVNKTANCVLIVTL